MGRPGPHPSLLPSDPHPGGSRFSKPGRLRCECTNAHPPPRTVHKCSLSCGSGWGRLQGSQAPSRPRPPTPEHTLTSEVPAGPHSWPQSGPSPLGQPQQPPTRQPTAPVLAAPVCAPHRSTSASGRPAHMPAPAPTAFQTRPRCPVMANGTLCHPDLSRASSPMSGSRQTERFLAPGCSFRP